MHPEHSGRYAIAGNLGQSATADPTIPKNESGHPIKHEFTRSIPSSQCIVCHIHPGTNMVATYFGYTWWDNEVDGDKMYPKEQRRPESEGTAGDPNAQSRAQLRFAELWSDVDFLEKTGTPEFNKELKNTQFADFHSHGWIFRAVFKHDRKGNLLDADDKQVSFDDPDKFKKAVHLKDIHLEKGMHCIDCHFRAGQSRQRKAIWRDAQRHRGRLRGLPRHDPATRDVADVRHRRARRRHCT